MWLESAFLFGDWKMAFAGNECTNFTSETITLIQMAGYFVFCVGLTVLSLPIVYKKGDGSVKFFFHFIRIWAIVGFLFIALGLFYFCKN